MRLRLAATLLALTAHPCLAQPLLSPQMAAVFPLGEDYCYVARPKPADMQSEQKLVEFFLYHSHDPNPTLEEVQMPREDAIASQAVNYSAYGLAWPRVLARLAGEPFLYSQTLSCAVDPLEGGEPYCGVDCDGGGFRVEKTEDGFDAVFDKDSGRVSLNRSCEVGDDDSIPRQMSAAEAGGVIRLVKSPMGDCLALDRIARPAFAKDPISLRERIARSGWHCLKYKSGEAHLLEPPQQEVTALAISIKGPARVDESKSDYPVTLLDLSLNLKLRSGETKNGESRCRAYGYQFYCAGGFRLRRLDDRSAMLVVGRLLDDLPPTPERQDAKNPPALFNKALGNDDKVFRLDASTDARCSLE